MARFTDRDRQDIHDLILKVDGDGNGNKGLIRRVDMIENSIRFIKRQNWAIIAMQLGLLGALLENFITK